MAIRYLSGINVDSNTLFVDSANDRVGIGTGSPTYKLDVVGEGRTSGAFMAGGAINIDSNLAIQISSAGAGTQRWIGINKNNGYGLIIGYVENAAALNGVGAYIRQVTSDPIHFLIDNSATAMSIVSGGNVGIGIATPSYKLQIAEDAYARIALHQTTTGAIWNWGNDGSNMYAYYANTFVRALDITPTGNVGIGTTSPSAKLEVLSAVSATPITNGLLRIVGTGTNPATGAGGGILLAQQDSAGSYVNYASITGRRVNNAANNIVDLDFNTGSPSDAVALATRMTITGNAGNVGIGTTAPSAKLQISGAAKITGGDWPTAGAGMELNYTSNTSFVGSYDRTNSVYKKLFFFGEDTTFETQGSVRMYIGANGNVGIGTTAPVTKLQVSGTLVGAPLVTITETSTAGNQYSQLEFGAGNRRAYIWLGNENTSAWAGAGGLNIYTANGNMDLWTNDVQRVRIDTSGNVGIGTTSPLSILDVYQSGQPQLRVRGTTGANHLYQDSVTGTTTSDGLFVGIGGDQTGYIYHYEANPLVFATSNAERMRITAAGNVGIGTTAPSYKLDVDGGSALVAARIYNSSNAATVVYVGDSGNTDYSDIILQTNSGTGEIFKAGTGYTSYGGALALNIYNSNGAIAFHPNSTANAMFIATNGNVGIGTTAPIRKLSILDAGSSFQLRVGYSNDYYYDIGRDPNDGYFDFYGNQTGFIGYRFGGVDGTRLSITPAGNVGIGTTAPNNKLSVVGNIEIQSSAGSKIGFNVNDSFSAYSTSVAHYGISYGQNAEPLALSGYFGIGIFTAGSERMRVAGNGNVGIGTTAPNAKLAIVASNGSTNAALINDTPTTAGTEVSYLSYFGTNNAGTMFATPLAQIGAISKNGGVAYGDLVFRTTPASGATAERVRITADGNVGIGTTSPGDKLSLAGSTSTTFGLSLEPSGWNNAKHRLTVPVSGDTSVWSFNYNGSAVDSSSYATSSISITQGVVLFSTGAANTAPSERMRIAPSGNVLIGTTTDSGLKLDVAGIIRGTSTNPFVIRAKTSSGSDSRISFEDPVNASNDSVWVGSTGHNLTFGAFYDERMRITSAGNVGIGTTAPTNKLHVVGIPRFDAEDSGPSTTTAPVTQDKYIGFNSAVLTDPTVWLRVNISGTEYLIPAYSE